VQDPLQIWNDGGQIKALLNGIQPDGRLVCEVRSQVEPSQPDFFTKQAFLKGETFVMVSCLLSDIYQVIGFKETQLTLQRKVDKTPVSTIESFSLRPRFDIFPPGERDYQVFDWYAFGCAKDPNQQSKYE